MAGTPDPRFELLMAEISARLLPVCEHWPREMFDEMVRGLAAITLRYERHLPTYDPAPTDAMIEEMRAAAERSAKLREKQEQQEQQ